jgi:DNA-binding transcriptional LysR family regulator
MTNKSRLSQLPPRYLEAVLAVARAGSVHAAARVLGMPQPAVSRLIAATEKALDVTLFTRTRSGSNLTETGERVVRQIAFALQALDGIVEAAQTPQPVLRVGCIPRVMHVLIPHLLSYIGEARAGFRMHVSVGTSQELASELDAAQLDFVIARRGDALHSMTADMLYSERTVVVAGRDNPLIPEDGCSLAELTGQQWVLPKRGYSSRDSLDAMVAAADLPPIEPVIEANSFESSLSVAAATRIITVAPEFAARRFEQLELVRIVPIRPPLGSSPIMLQYRPSQKEHPAFDDFRAAVMAAARRIRGD